MVTDTRTNMSHFFNSNKFIYAFIQIHLLMTKAYFFIEQNRCVHVCEKNIKTLLVNIHSPFLFLFLFPDDLK